MRFYLKQRKMQDLFQYKIHWQKYTLARAYCMGTMKTRSQEPENFALLSLFFDVKRKYVRFENMAKMIASGEKLSHDEIIDTLSDLAVYGVMGLMLMDYLEGNSND